MLSFIVKSIIIKLFTSNALEWQCVQVHSFQLSAFYYSRDNYLTLECITTVVAWLPLCTARPMHQILFEILKVFLVYVHTLPMINDPLLPRSLQFVWQVVVVYIKLLNMQLWRLIALIILVLSFHAVLPRLNLRRLADELDRSVQNYLLASHRWLSIRWESSSLRQRGLVPKRGQRRLI